MLSFYVFENMHFFFILQWVIIHLSRLANSHLVCFFQGGKKYPKPHSVLVNLDFSEHFGLHCHSIEQSITGQNF